MLIIWITAIAYWILLTQVAGAAAVVFGLGLLLTVVGGLGGWRREICALTLALFFILSLVQMGCSKFVLRTALDPMVYPDGVSAVDRAVAPRQDAKWAMRPHSAYAAWLRRIENSGNGINPNPFVEKLYDLFLKRNEQEDTQAYFFVLFDGMGEEDGLCERMIQECDFNDNVVGGLIWRHMKYHGCTIEQLRKDAAANTDAAERAEVKRMNR